MPLVQYRHPSLNVNITRKMFTPKRIQSLGHWLKDARKVIKEIPHIDPNGRGWTISAEGASVEKVSFELFNTITSERVYVVIDRTVKGM